MEVKNRDDSVRDCPLGSVVKLEIDVLPTLRALLFQI